jgi:transposase
LRTGTMRPLSTHGRHRIVATFEQLKSRKATARKLQVTVKTVKRWVGRAKASADLEARRQTGRPRALSDPALSWALRVLTTENLSLPQLACRLHSGGYTTRRLHRTTVGRWLKQHAKSQGKRLRALTGKPKAALSQSNKQARVDFARANLNRDWGQVIFTDRKRFLLRRPGSSVGPVTWTVGDRERTASQVSNPVAVNVYAGITRHGITQCHIVTGTTSHKTTYLNKKGQPARNITAAEYSDVLVKTLLPEGDRLFKARGVPQRWVLQQDNDPSHRAAEQHVTAWRRQRNRSVEILKKWPPNSPDLNIIENIWSIVDAKLLARGCKNASEFKQAVKEEMSSVSKDTIVSLFESMPRRMRNVLHGGGERLKS